MKIALYIEDGLTTKRRSPLHDALTYLQSVRQWEGDVHFAVVAALRQAALDGDIPMWGEEQESNPSNSTPPRVKIESDHWRDHGIDPTSISVPPSEAPRWGAFSEADTSTARGYYHLHTDMTAVRKAWPAPKFWRTLPAIKGFLGWPGRG